MSVSLLSHKSIQLLLHTFFGVEVVVGNQVHVAKAVVAGVVALFLSSLEKVIKLDMQKWLKLLADMDLSPDVHGQDIRYLFLQKVEGDVTIIPSLKFSDFLHLVSDPGYKDMESYIRRGELATWPCILHIQSFLRLEQVLRECLLSLQEKYVDKKESN